MAQGYSQSAPRAPVVWPARLSPFNAPAMGSLRRCRFLWRAEFGSHISEEKFVFVEHTSNNIKDGVSLRRRKKRDDTFDVNLKCSRQNSVASVLLRAVCGRCLAGPQLHSLGCVGSQCMATSHRSPLSAWSVRMVDQPPAQPLPNA